MNSETELTVVTLLLSVVFLGMRQWLGFETAVLSGLAVLIGAVLSVADAVRKTG